MPPRKQKQIASASASISSNELIPSFPVPSAMLPTKTGEEETHTPERSPAKRGAMTITEAQKQGIVEIRVHDQTVRSAELEQALKERYGLAHVRVAAFRPGADVTAAAGDLAAQWLDESLRDGDVLGLSWGTTLQAMVDAFSVDQPRNVEVVPLMGGLATDGSVVASRNSSASWRPDSERRTAAYTDQPCCTPIPRATRCLPNRRSAGSWRGLVRPTSRWSASERSARTRASRSSRDWG